MGFETVEPLAAPVPEQVKQILGVPEVDAAVDCVGFEARGHRDGTEQNAAVLNQAMEVTRAAGAIGIPGLYVTEDPGAQDPAARQGTVSLRFGIGWAKPLTFATGQTRRCSTTGPGRAITLRPDDRGPFGGLRISAPRLAAADGSAR